MMITDSEIPMSIANKKKSDCCGCNACAEICPTRCIEMTADRKGFLYPRVDATACIGCGACEKVCPLPKGNIGLHRPVAAWAAWSKDRTQHRASSSGGAAHVLASYIIMRERGVVYGCTAEGMRIRHIRVETLPELARLQGSKYVQSDVRGLYGQVKTDVGAGRPVLFIGTPCQTAGLKRFMQQVPEHLYLADLICHGVPSQQMLQEHVGHVAEGRPATRISFRRGTDIRLSLSEGDRRYYEADVFREPYKDLYLQGFMAGITYRPSCYRCPYARPERVSDITLGDFWRLPGIDALPAEAKDGVSVLLPATVKGARLIASITPEMRMYRRTVDEAVRGNSQLRHPVRRGWRSRWFDRLYPACPFEAALRLVLADLRALRKIKDLVYHLRHVGRR